MNSPSVARRVGYGVRRTKAFTPVAVLFTILLGGCVRIAGTAGYAKVNPDGETTVKQASVDTAKLVTKDKTPGSITV